MNPQPNQTASGPQALTASRLTRCVRYVGGRKKRFLTLLFAVAHGIGALTSVHAVMETRTSQGAIAWAVSLNSIPMVAVPAYLVFGRSKFNGYIKIRQAQADETDPLIQDLIEQARLKNLLLNDDSLMLRVQERLAKMPATLGNEVEMLRNGEQIFPSIFEGLSGAKDYALVQFYIVRDDALGRRLQQHLLDAAERGVRVSFLYDEVGCYQLPGAFLEQLRAGGVEVRAFHSTQGSANRFQLNFRNHRKIVVVDGHEAWIGGVNVGDEYMGEHPRLTPWIDTMVKVTGPAVAFIQVPFQEDWRWADGEPLQLNWTLSAAPSGTSQKVLCLPTGPADRFESCALYFLNAINSATVRCWIASPYFVPDEQIVSALKLAAMRGVDVRVLVPDDCDNQMVRLAGWSYVAPLEEAGVKIYRHTKGFMHHKLMLVDDQTAAVGTANFDNRSFRLNFEITLEVHDATFASELEEVFERDFADARLSSELELEERSFWVRLAVRVSRLFAPVL